MSVTDKRPSTKPNESVSLLIARSREIERSRSSASSVASFMTAKTSIVDEDKIRRRRMSQSPSSSQRRMPSPPGSSIQLRSSSRSSSHGSSSHARSTSSSAKLKKPKVSFADVEEEIPRRLGSRQQPVKKSRQHLDVDDVAVVDDDDDDGDDGGDDVHNPFPTATSTTTHRRSRSRSPSPLPPPNDINAIGTKVHRLLKSVCLEKGKEREVDAVIYSYKAGEFAHPNGFFYDSTKVEGDRRRKGWFCAVVIMPDNPIKEFEGKDAYLEDCVFECYAVTGVESIVVTDHQNWLFLRYEGESENKKREKSRHMISISRMVLPRDPKDAISRLWKFAYEAYKRKKLKDDHIAAASSA